MVKKTHILFGLSFFLLAACSTKKDTFVARNYHSLTTKFNVLFNGKEAFAEGIKEINSKYEDDFWEQIPIEPIKFERREVVTLGGNFGNPGMPGQTKNTSSPFDKAEEKAVKAIQKHSMNIYGIERNKQIDDAYLLLGKSRYYTQRFIPAIEALNYVIAKYPKANLIPETKIWRAKSNIRLDNEGFAVETLTLLLTGTLLTDEIKEQAHTAMAMAYVKMDSTRLVKKHLWKAFRTTENIDQAARNMFVLGQVYSKEQNKDSAAIVFNKLINFKKAPYKYRIHAEIELAKNSVSDSTTVQLLDHFKKLIKNRDNRPYLDGLYYQVAEIEYSRDSVSRAINYYNKSLRAKGAKEKQKTYSYEKLADIYFKNLEYVTASNYYDSVLHVAKDKQNLRIKRIERLVKNLASLIEYESSLKSSDSVLSLVAMSVEERKTHFGKHIENLKKQDELAAQKRLNQLSFGSAFGGGSGIQASNNKGKWYFYNVQFLGFGEAEFKRVWGTRSSEDNWRWSDKATIASKKQDSVRISQKSNRYELSHYLKQIPTEKRVIDSITATRNESLFELGLIYKEQFTNKPKSIGNLERLLSLSPNQKYILPTNYHLYQLYQDTDVVKSDKHKNVILTDFSESPFSKIILNPDQTPEEDKEVDEILNLYTIAYNVYKNDNFEDVICFVDMSLATIESSILIPKFKLLKAYAIGKVYDRETYKKALEEVAVDYPETDEGKDALSILNRLKK